LIVSLLSGTMIWLSSVHVLIFYTFSPIFFTGSLYLDRACSIDAGTHLVYQGIRIKFSYDAAGRSLL